MFWAAEELITAGGPSAPAWAFFSGIVLALIGVLAQQLKARSDLKQLKELSQRVESEAISANESATKAQTNTQNVSNGFALRVDTKLDRIQSSVNDTNKALRETEKALREHIEWHLEQEKR